VSNPPIERWIEDGALGELARLARDLPHVDAEEARRRLERLTPEQRALIDGTLRTLEERL
jgi:hypothetical protein